MLRDVIFRILAGSIGLFLLGAMFVPPGPPDPWAYILALVLGGILVFYAATGRSPVSRRTEDLE